MKQFLLFIWQLPQNLIGLLILLVNIKSVKRDKEHKAFRVKHLCDCGISLGNYVIIDLDACDCDDCFGHESGHSIQSKKLGWLYLLIIGLPSITGNIIDRIFHKGWKTSRRLEWYYSQPWEHNANVLGGVEESYKARIETLKAKGY